MILGVLIAAQRILPHGVYATSVAPCLHLREKSAVGISQKIVFRSVPTSNFWYWSRQWWHLQSATATMYSHFKMTVTECVQCGMVRTASTCCGRMGTLADQIVVCSPPVACGKSVTNRGWYLDVASQRRTSYKVPKGNESYWITQQGKSTSRQLKGHKSHRQAIQSIKIKDVKINVHLMG